MKQTLEFQAVDLVRRIRDAQAEELADKSVAEVMEFFNRAVAVLTSTEQLSGQLPTRFMLSASRPPKPTTENNRDTYDT